jgi:hypothetical protein
MVFSLSVASAVMGAGPLAESSFWSWQFWEAPLHTAIGGALAIVLSAFLFKLPRLLYTKPPAEQRTAKWAYCIVLVVLHVVTFAMIGVMANEIRAGTDARRFLAWTEGMAMLGVHTMIVTSSFGKLPKEFFSSERSREWIRATLAVVAYFAWVLWLYLAVIR